MTELKTLKDLFNTGLHGECRCTGCEESVGCDIQPIKQEAIKWVPKKAPENTTWADNSYNHGFREGITHFIKHFFNISEADLTSAKETKVTEEELKDG